MRIQDIIYEARRNPELNKSERPIDTISRYLNASSTILGNNKNLFISMTDIAKLGINPNSRFNTPNGIYSYTGQYVVDTVQRGRLNALPFAGDKPYVNIFQVRDPASIIVLSSLTKSDVERYVQKIQSMPEYASHIPQYTGPARVQTPGGILWYITMKVSEGFAQENSRSVPLVWSTLFRKLGINGCIDTGQRIIHPAEPYQSVFFDTSIIRLLDRIANTSNKNVGPTAATRAKIRDLFRSVTTADEYENAKQYSSNMPGVDPEISQFIVAFIPLDILVKFNIDDAIRHLELDPRAVGTKVEKYFTASPEYALRYATLVDRRFPAGERAILTDPKSAFLYTTKFFPDRWPEAEDIISTNAETAMEYAIKILQKRWPKGEPAILTDPDSAFLYTKRFFTNGWPEAEPIISKNAITAFNYASIILNGGRDFSTKVRFPAGEKAIATNPKTAFQYAKMLGKPFPAGEKAIATDGGASLNYAIYALNARFPAGEKAIALLFDGQVSDTLSDLINKYDSRFGTNIGTDYLLAQYIVDGTKGPFTLQQLKSEFENFRIFKNTPVFAIMSNTSTTAGKLLNKV